VLLVVCAVDVAVAATLAEGDEPLALEPELLVDEPPPVKMSVCAPSGKPHLELYAGLLGAPEASYPETSMLFPSSWFQ